MFYILGKTASPEPCDCPAEGVLTAGYLTANELAEMNGALGFSDANINACRSADGHFRSGVEVYDNYTFTELRIADMGRSYTEDDCVALFIKRDMFIVVDVEDGDGSTRIKFMNAIKRYPMQSVTLEKVICAFLDSLLAENEIYIEDLGDRIADFEELIVKDEFGEDINLDLLNLKKESLRIHNYYEQLLDITGAMEDNENDIFPDDGLMYVSNISKKITRLREDADSLGSSVNHLQDAYSALTDIKMNRTMKVLTVITTVFLPLTIIVGWYGMNFVGMPEYTWKYGYVYVSVLSAVVIVALTVYCKKKKWF